MTLPQTFQAALLPEAGARHVIGERSLSPLEPGEVAIRITATAINPVDWKIRDYKAIVNTFPAVLGSDGAGEIAAVGSDVSHLAVGDRVFFQGIINKFDSSTFQQYCKMPAELLSKTPNAIKDEEAAGIFVTSIAAVTGIYDESGHGLTPPWAAGGQDAGKNTAIVILAGSSSIGQYAIQLAKLSGFAKIITTSSSKHATYLKDLGADIVLDRSSTPDEFIQALDGLPLAFIFDAVSKTSTIELGIKVLQNSGTKGSYVVVVQRVSSDEISALLEKEPKVAIKPIFGVGSKPSLRYLSEPFAKAVGGEDGWIAKGVYKPNRPEVVPGGLAGLEEALAKSKNGVSGVKVVIKPFDH